MKTSNVGLILITALACWLMSCSKNPEKQSTTPPLSVRTAIVQEKLVSFPIHCSGKLSSRNEMKLSFKTGGIIRKIYVDEGRSVEAGTLLAALDLSEIKSKAQQADLAMQKAGRDFERARNLYNDSVATLEQFQDARTALEVARSNARIAKFNLDYSEIRAPSKGKILKKIAEENEIIGAGYPVFFFASTEEAWVVRVNITDRDVVKIRLLDSASVSFDAYPDVTFSAQVSEIGNASDPYTSTYEVELSLVQQPETLVSGFISKVDIFPSDRKSMLVLPVEALIEGNDMTGHVFVVDDDKPVKRTVGIAAITDTALVVSSGLSAGEEVIVEGGEYVREGSAIRRMN